MCLRGSRQTPRGRDEGVWRGTYAGELELRSVNQRPSWRAAQRPSAVCRRKWGPVQGTCGERGWHAQVSGLHSCWGAAEQRVDSSSERGTRRRQLREEGQSALSGV